LAPNQWEVYRLWNILYEFVCSHTFYRSLHPLTSHPSCFVEQESTQMKFECVFAGRGREDARTRGLHVVMYCNCSGLSLLDTKQIHY